MTDSVKGFWQVREARLQFVVHIDEHVTLDLDQCIHHTLATVVGRNQFLNQIFKCCMFDELASCASCDHFWQNERLDNGRLIFVYSTSTSTILRLSETLACVSNLLTIATADGTSSSRWSLNNYVGTRPSLAYKNIDIFVPIYRA